jgi:magnesium transporter
MAKAETVGKRAPLKTRRPPVGASPGTLIADPSARRSELRLTLISPEKFETIENASIDDLNTHCDSWPVIWLDCTGLANIPLIEEIGRIFSLHPLALEDVVNTGQRPKVDFFEDHAFVVVRMIDDVTAHRYEQIAVFFGKISSSPSRSARATRSIPCASASKARCPTGCARVAPTISPMR